MIPSTAINGNRADGYIGQVIDIEPNEDYLVSAFAKVDISEQRDIFTARWFDDTSKERLFKITLEKLLIKQLIQPNGKIHVFFQFR